MTTLHAPHALLPGGWARDVRITLAGGRIAAVEPDSAPAPQDERLTARALVPAVANLHSHAFQRAMAGMTGLRGEGTDDFWTWRRVMYRFLDLLTPDEVEAIAAFAQMEMIEAGFAAVAEFHYLHHAPGGAPYADPAELSGRIVAAARASGIGLTLLPVFYARGGADGRPLAGGQARFGCGLDAFARLAEAGRAHLAAGPADAGFGVAPHSLRAATPVEAAAVAEAFPDVPRHIHAAEQTAEVAEVAAAFGARPVEILLDRVGIGPDWTLIHATHLTAAERDGLAASGAVAGLCPVTEADLGDGVFPADAYRRAGGRFGVGTDSNVAISCAGELRALEASQRLTLRARNVLADPGAHVGETLLLAAAHGGARALGRACGAIAPGLWADLVALDLGRPTLAALRPAQLVDGWVFSDGDRAVADVWAAGRRVARDGRHVARDALAARYAATMADLKARL